MLDILASYLSDAATSELKDAIERAHQVFETIQLPDFESAFEELLQLDGGADHGVTVQAIASLTRDLQTRILAEHMVVLRDDCSIEWCSQFIEGLLLLPQYEDAVTLRRILALNVPTEEVMAELMELVTAYNAAQWLHEIESVSYALIERLRSVLPPEKNEGSGHLTQDERRMRQVVMSRLLVNSPKYTSPVLALIAAGMDMGYPFALYAAEIGHEVETLGVEDAALELMLMAILSSDGYHEPVALIKKHLDHFVGDADMATQVLVRVQQHSLALQQRAAVTKVPG